MKRFATVTSLLIILVVSTQGNAQPRRGDNPDTPINTIIKIVRHLIGLDDPSLPKP